MPAGVVKPGEESKWAKAKSLAAQQGHAKDWAYINGIFQKMKGGGEGLHKAMAGFFIGPRGGKWADAAHTEPWHDSEAASHNGVFRYGAAYRPVGFPNVPKGAQHEPHKDFKHGQAVYDRPLTADEIRSYELTPILNDVAVEQRVARVLDEMHEYADSYREMLEEEPRNAEQIIRQALERQGSGHYDMKAAVKRVVLGLKDPELETGVGRSLTKSELVPAARGDVGQPKFIISTWPGQVPTRMRLEEQRLAKEMAMPSPFNPAMLFNPGGTYMTASSVVDGLGFDRAQESDWRQFMGKALSSPNELTLRQSMLSKMLNERLDAPRRRALFGRALSFYRDMRKSMVNVVTVDDLRKSDTYGGIVDNFQQGDPEERIERVRQVINNRVANAGPCGLSLDKLGDVVKAHGRDAVAQVLTKACAKSGHMTFKKGTLKFRG